MEIGWATAGGASSNRSNPMAARVRWCESSRTSSHDSGEKMRRCGRRGIFQHVRRRASRGNPHEIPRDPGIGPSRSDPVDVPGPGRVGDRLLRVARTARESPVHPGAYPALGHSCGRPGVETYGSSRIWAALVKQGHHPVESPVARGREHAQSPVPGDTAYPGLGRGPHLRVDDRGLALPGRDPRSGLTPRGRLGHGPAADRGASRAGPHDGAGTPKPTGRASAPFRSRESVCGHARPAAARRAGPHPQHEPHGQLLG